MRRLLVLAACGALAACTIEPRVDRVVEEPADSSTSEFLRPWGEAAPPAGVRSGDLVWIWAMAGTVPGSNPPRLVEGGVAAEARQALDNVVAVLASGGATARDVAQCSVFLADAAEADVLAEVYREYFPAAPQRIGAVLTPLTLGARVEIECTAVVPPAP
jgi:enamine deaminase RidA (YjgF/YER057c/UK114 family)